MTGRKRKKMIFERLSKARFSALLTVLAASTVILCASMMTPASAATASSGSHAVTTAVAPNTDHVIYPSYYVTVTGEKVASASAVTSDSIPVYHVTSAGYLSGIHSCLELGNDGTVQGVQCADMWAEPDGSGGVIVEEAAEAFCNVLNSSSYPGCQNIDVGFQLAQGTGIQTGWDGISCGPDSGLSNTCGTGRQYGIGTYPGTGFDITGCDPEPGTAYEFWTVLMGGNSIQLPSGTTVSDSSNFAGQHAIVCP
jgi:hypothetical protein